MCEVGQKNLSQQFAYYYDDCHYKSCTNDQQWTVINTSAQISMPELSTFETFLPQNLTWDSVKKKMDNFFRTTDER